MSPVGQSNWLIFFIHNSFHHSAPSSCPSCVLVGVLTRERVSGACFRSKLPRVYRPLSHSTILQFRLIDLMSFTPPQLVQYLCSDEQYRHFNKTVIIIVNLISVYFTVYLVTPVSYTGQQITSRDLRYPAPSSVFWTFLANRPSADLRNSPHNVVVLVTFQSLYLRCPMLL